MAISCHFERSEKSLFRPEGEIFIRSLTAFGTPAADFSLRSK